MPAERWTPASGCAPRAHLREKGARPSWTEQAGALSAASPSPPQTRRSRHHPQRLFYSAGDLVASRLTDFSGRFFVFDLPAGTYFVSTTNFLGFGDKLYDGRPCRLGNCDPTSGTPIVVVPFSTRRNVDFSLGDFVYLGGD